MTNFSQFSVSFADAVCEQYAARRAKTSPGQLGLFGDGFGGDALRSAKTQQRMPWDESKHPRASDGRFGTKPGMHGGKGGAPGADEQKTPEQRPAESRQRTPEQLILGKRAGDSKVLGAMLYQQLEAKKPVSLLGQKVSSAEDVAQLAQVYRDPRYETLRAFFVKDGVIIGQNAYSSRHPAAVALPENMLEQLDADIASLQADGFYLLHNHPSGAPDPSPEDIAVTKRIEEVMPGKLLDHVIIDHTQGSIIDKSGKVRYYKADNENLQKTEDATVPHEYLGKKILSTVALGQLAMHLNPKEDRAVMVFTNVKGAVQMLVDVNPKTLVGERSFKVLAAVRRAARASNSDRRFLILPEGANTKDYEHLTRTGVVTDVAAPGAKTAMEAGATGNGDPIQRRIKGREIMRERFAAFDREAFVDRMTATLLGMTPEQYAARRSKSSPGQLGLFGDGFGNELLRSTRTQGRFDWDESKHPRDAEGKFTEKGSGTAGGGKKPKAKKPFVYPNGQTQAFGGDGNPEGAAGTDSEPPPEAKPEDDASTGQREESEDITPRERAKQAADEDQGDYEFARKSAVPNAGEDLKGSARHKVNAWRSLEDAENDGTAEKLVTRDQLLKNEPHSLAAHAQKDSLTALAMHLALKAFPPKPGAGNRYYNPSAEQAKKDRRQYVEAYRKIKEAAENEAKKAAVSPLESTKALARVVKEEIVRLREKGNDGEPDRYNATANSLVDLHKKLSQSWLKTGVSRQVAEFAELDKKHHGELSSGDRLEAIRDKVMSVLEGKSIKAAFGAQSGTKQPFNPADMYVAHASREGGPAMPATTAKAATQYLVEKSGFRGVQFGNSVSDSEREHHATMAAAAMLDLADVTGLPLAAIGLGGKLGLAIGARGRANALAHYETGERVINLTRKKGVGSLAHEWAHALDHEMGGGEAPEMDSRGRRDVRFHSEDSGVQYSGTMVDGKWVSQRTDRSSEPLHKAMEGLRKAMRESGFQGRLPDAMKERGISWSKSKYWTSGREMFARSFERYVQRKLEKAGRKNTYLAGIETKSYKNGGLWPTDAEVDQMAPHFETLLEAWRKEKHGLDEPVRYSASERQAFIERLTATMLGRPQPIVDRFASLFADAVVERYRTGGKPQQDGEKPKTVIGTFGDRGHFVTIDGHVVFIKHDGQIEDGPRHMKGRNARDFKSVSRRKRGPRTERPDRFTPKTKQDHAIVATVGDHPDDVEAFREHVQDAHKFLTQQTTETNHAMRELLAQFGYTGRQASGFLSSLQRQRDTAGIRSWDQMAEYGASYYPELLAGSNGESSGKGDNEYALFSRLKQGFQPPPSKHAPEVIELAMQMAGPRFLEDGGAQPNNSETDDDLGGRVLEDPDDPFSDFVPFAAKLGHAL